MDVFVVNEGVANTKIIDPSHCTSKIQGYQAGSCKITEAVE